MAGAGCHDPGLWLDQHRPRRPGAVDPAPGGDSAGARLRALFGGKGANQAVAAARATSGSGRVVAMAGRVGNDEFGRAALANPALRREPWRPGPSRAAARSLRSRRAVKMPSPSRAAPTAWSAPATSTDASIRRKLSSCRWRCPFRVARARPAGAGRRRPRHLELCPRANEFQRLGYTRAHRGLGRVRR